jgi:hypothetical protein
LLYDGDALLVRRDFDDHDDATAFAVEGLRAATAQTGSPS